MDEYTFLSRRKMSADQMKIPQITIIRTLSDSEREMFLEILTKYYYIRRLTFSMRKCDFKAI